MAQVQAKLVEFGGDNEQREQLVEEILAENGCAHR